MPIYNPLGIPTHLKSGHDEDSTFIANLKKVFNKESVEQQEDNESSVRNRKQVYKLNEAFADASEAPAKETAEAAPKAAKPAKAAPAEAEGGLRAEEGRFQPSINKDVPETEARS